MDYKHILKYYEKQFEGLTLSQIGKILRSRGFRSRWSSGVAFIHPHLDFVVKFSYLLGKRPRKAAKTVISKKIIDEMGYPLIVQEKCDCSYHANRKAFKSLNKKGFYWRDAVDRNCGLDKRGKAVIVDW